MARPGVVDGLDVPEPTRVVDVVVEPQVGGRVRFDLDDDDQSLMTIEHTLLPSGEFDNYDNGWTLTVDQLVARLTR